ncbi:uncharacterized protein BT62DRAFT_722569 [Guyanagaster necrorhizus]|uniref:Uncharacterized protein n=1 Tax=Guyanagaster necrorhizus TaxID=856835 RepID=A0A9P7VXE2_9AGAR|nr:uncharacterized protein BT62DRAFT_722569 [Guyanagaster necrorhizus MCA 3950]KAG7448704.1 hypothetical protein BT62DRAFT_722569 [Guyanagaster necrorhizus MCA 3950]
MAIPQELMDVIIDFNHDDNQALRACALASRAFVASSQLHLFSRIKLILSDSAVRETTLWKLSGHTFQRFHTMIFVSPHIAPLVTTLEIYFDITYCQRPTVDTSIFTAVLTSLTSLKRYVLSAGLDSIDFRGCSDEPLTRAIFNDVPAAGLVELCLDGVESIPYADIFSTSGKWPSLKSLSMLWSSFQQQDVVWDLASLESLKVGGLNSFLYFEDWLSKNNFCSKLRWKKFVAVITSPDDVPVVRTALSIPTPYLEEVVIDHSFPMESTDPSIDLRTVANLRT